MSGFENLPPVDSKNVPAKQSGAPAEDKSVAKQSARSSEIRKQDETANSTMVKILDKFDISCFSVDSTNALEKAVNDGFLYLASAFLKKDSSGKPVEFPKDIFDASVMYVSGEVILSTQPEGKGNKRTIKIDGPYMGNLASAEIGVRERTDAEKKAEETIRQICDKYKLPKEELQERIGSGENMQVGLEELDATESLIKRFAPNGALRQFDNDDIAALALMSQDGLVGEGIPPEMRLQAAQEAWKNVGAELIDLYKKHKEHWLDIYDFFLKRESGEDVEEDASE